MVIKFDEIPVTELKAFNGGEGALLANLRVDECGKILRGRLEKGCSIGMHTHDTSSEVIFILSGNGKAICDGVEETLTAGDCHYCKKGSAHSLINAGEDALCFYAVVPVQ